MITVEQREVLKNIYDALADETSRNIYKHRLLYSLYGEGEEIVKMVRECLEGKEVLEVSKVCYYGAGAGAGWMVKCYENVPFIIDKFRTGELEGHPIISMEQFLGLPDYKEYLIIITVGKEKIRQEIANELSLYGLNYIFAYFDSQYFDLPELSLSNEYFVDVGALDGETTKFFLEHFENGYAYVFEPNPAQLAISKECLRDYGGVEFFPYGLYDKNGAVSFDTCETDAGSARVSEYGKMQIEVRKLDDVLKDRPVSFIKMDIEGSELAALKGAEEIIRKQTPKLAICVYHKPEDIWEIAQLILTYNSNYRLYLRHYSISYTETVLYAVV